MCMCFGDVALEAPGGMDFKWIVSKPANFCQKSITKSLNDFLFKTVNVVDRLQMLSLLNRRRKLEAGQTLFQWSQHEDYSICQFSMFSKGLETWSGLMTEWF